jgi:hypothetical protein
MSSGGGGSSEPQAVSTIDPEQRKLLKIAADFLGPQVGGGATPLPFDPSAEQNELFSQAFEQFSAAFSDPSRSQAVTQGLEDILSGVGTFKPDIDRVSREFNRTITTPVAGILRDTLGLDVQNTLNQPGRLFASDTRENVGRAITQELGRSTAPLLAQSLEAERGRGFASQENFLARQQGAISALQSQPITEFQQAFGAAGLEQQNRQEIINRQTADFLRLSPENDPFLQLALGLSTAPTFGVGQTQSEGGGSFAGLGSGLGALAGLGIAAALPGPLTAKTALIGAGIGSAGGGGIGSAFGR